MKSWDIDPATGDYMVDASGKPKETDSLRVPAFIRLRARRLGWMYAPDANWGSDFWTVRKRHVPQDGASLENLALRALEPLVDDGRAKDVTVDAQVQSRYGVGLQVDILDASGQNQELKFDPVK